MFLNIPKAENLLKEEQCLQGVLKFQVYINLFFNFHVCIYMIIYILK